jgi:hypothetical protein
MSSDAPETAARPLIRNLRLGLLTVAWGAALVTILSGQAHGITATCGAAALGLFILLTLPRLRRDSLIILAMLGVVMLFILDDVPSLEDMTRGGERVLIFAALLPTMALVRATAMTMPSVHATQERLGRLPAVASAGGLQLAAHVFGGIINTGAFALLSAALPPDSGTHRRRIAAEAAIRGMVVSSAWSPFFVAFAIGQIFVAPAYAWMAIALGTVSAFLFMVVTIVGLHRGFKGTELRQSLACLSPVASRLAAVLAAVLVVAVVLELTALSAVVTVMPLLVLIQMLRHREKVTVIIADTCDAMNKTADDIVVITAAMLVAFFAISSASLASMVAGIYSDVIPGWIALPAVPIMMMSLSVIGIHPVITSTTLLAIFSGGGADVHPALLVQAHLVGWGAGTMSSVASLSVLSCATLYRVPTRQLVFGANIISGFGYAVVGGVGLALINMLI